MDRGFTRTRSCRFGFLTGTVVSSFLTPTVPVNDWWSNRKVVGLKGLGTTLLVEISVTGNSLIGGGRALGLDWSHRSSTRLVHRFHKRTPKSASTSVRGPSRRPGKDVSTGGVILISVSSWRVGALNGIRCSLRCFVWADGLIKLRNPCHCISHRATRTSLRRAPVSMSNLIDGDIDRMDERKGLGRQTGGRTILRRMDRASSRAAVDDHVGNGPIVIRRSRTADR